MSVSNFKIKPEHWEVLIDFMENHKDFACGRVTAINARETYKKLWTELSTKLNSLGYGVRPVEKWQKCWADYKSNLKKKAAQIKTAREQTGGGPGLAERLNSLEQRVLQVMGQTSYAGCGTKELGFETNIDDSTSSLSCAAAVSASCLPHNANSLTLGAEESIMVDENINVPQDVTFHRTPSAVGENNLKRHHEASDHDHTYLAASKKKKSKKHDDIYTETITVLSIENTLERGLANINETLTNSLGILADILLRSK